MPDIVLGGIEFEDTEVDVLGFAFGRDLQNQTITEKSLYVNTLPYVFLTLHHCKSLIEKDGVFVGDKFPIGVAEYRGMNDKGYIYRLYTEKAKAYKTFIQDIDREGLLATSNTPLQRAAVNGLEKDGWFAAYPGTEIAIEPIPANPRSTQWFDQVLLEKGFKVMEEKEKTEETKETTPVVPETPPAEPEVSAEAELDKLIEKTNATAVVDPTDPTLADRLTLIEKSIGELKDMITGVSGKVKDTQAAIPKLGQLIEKNVTASLLALSAKSPQERDALTSLIEKGVKGGSAPVVPPANQDPFAGSTKFYPNGKGK